MLHFFIPSLLVNFSGWEYMTVSHRGPQGQLWVFNFHFTGAVPYAGQFLWLQLTVSCPLCVSWQFSIRMLTSCIPARPLPSLSLVLGYLWTQTPSVNLLSLWALPHSLTITVPTSLKWKILLYIEFLTLLSWLSKLHSFYHLLLLPLPKVQTCSLVLVFCCSLFLYLPSGAYPDSWFQSLL